MACSSHFPSNPLPYILTQTVRPDCDTQPAIAAITNGTVAADGEVAVRGEVVAKNFALGT